jgi:uncharacterized membrane protein YhhN
MWLLLYALGFWSFAFLFMVLKSARDGETAFGRGFASRIHLAPLLLIKAVPAGLAALFVFLLRPSSSLFYLLMVVALVLCLLGDVGKGVGLLPGIGLFALAHVAFITAFVTQSLTLGIIFQWIAVTGGVLMLILIYVYLLHRYLQSSKKGLGRFQIPVLFYSLLISIMFCTSVLLWLLSGTLYGSIVVIGAFLFVISDSMIAVKEFHHRFSKAELKILGTYYSAIFFFSLNVLIFAF